MGTAIAILLGLVFRIYVQKFGRYEQTYGTVGGVAVLLLFFYVDSLVLLIGAEINAEVDNAMRHFTRRKLRSGRGGRRKHRERQKPGT